VCNDIYHLNLLTKLKLVINKVAYSSRSVQLYLFSYL